MFGLADYASDQEEGNDSDKDKDDDKHEKYQSFSLALPLDQSVSINLSSKLTEFHSSAASSHEGRDNRSHPHLLRALGEHRKPSDSSSFGDLSIHLKRRGCRLSFVLL
jgi:hypothetical protein